MTVCIIDYGAGNLRSVAKAFEYVAESGQEIIVSADPKMLKKATHIVLPGVGAFADCMQGLKNMPGLLNALQEHVLLQKKWFLGICVGMQMLFERGLEFGEHAGLGWIKGEVVPLSPADKNLKIPHMGWNELGIAAPQHSLLKGIGNEQHAYFVHSYQAVCENQADILATTNYGGKVTAIVGRDNILGTQFHPEKSQETGLRLLSNFLKMN